MNNFIPTSDAVSMNVNPSFGNGTLTSDKIFSDLTTKKISKFIKILAKFRKT